MPVKNIFNKNELLLLKKLAPNSVDRLQEYFNNDRSLDNNSMENYQHMMRDISDAIVEQSNSSHKKKGFALFKKNELKELKIILDKLHHWQIHLNLSNTNIDAIKKWQNDLTTLTDKEDALDDFKRNFTIGSQSQEEMSTDRIKNNLREIVLPIANTFEESLLIEEWIAHHGGQAMTSFITDLFHDGVFGVKMLAGRINTKKADWSIEKKEGLVFNFTLAINQLTDLTTNTTTYKTKNQIITTQNTDELEKIKDEERLNKKSILEPVVMINGKCQLSVFKTADGKSIVKPEITSFIVMNHAGNVLNMPNLFNSNLKIKAIR